MDMNCPTRRTKLTLARQDELPWADYRFWCKLDDSCSADAVSIVSSTMCGATSLPGSLSGENRTWREKRIYTRWLRTRTSANLERCKKVDAGDDKNQVGWTGDSLITTTTTESCRAVD